MRFTKNLINLAVLVNGKKEKGKNKMEIADPLYFSWFVACILLVVSMAYVSPRFGWNKVRKVVTLDGVDEILKSCAERGRPVIYSPCGTKLGQPHTTSGLEMAKMVARTCSDLNIHLWSYATDAENYVLMVDYVRQGYMESSHPERWSPMNNVYVPDFGNACSLPNLVMEMTEAHNVGGAIYMGGITWNTELQVFEHAKRHGCMTFSGMYWPDGVNEGLLWADFVTITDELVAAGAYLGKDPVDGAFIVGSDLVKILMAITMVVLAIRTVLRV